MTLGHFTANLAYRLTWDNLPDKTIHIKQSPVLCSQINDDDDDNKYTSTAYANDCS